MKQSVRLIVMRVVLLAGIGSLLVVSSGCASKQMLTLRERPASPLVDQLKLYSTGGPKPSERTRLVLRRNDLPETVSSSSPQHLLQKISAVHKKNPTAESCYALAELNFIAGKKSELRSRKIASQFYLTSVARTYEFLFGPRYRIARNPYDPQFRGACDLYNGALENVLRIAKRDHAFQPGKSMVFQTTNGQKVEILIKPVSKSWQTSDFDRFEFVSDYEVTGLKNQYRSFGLGVPLIAVRRRHAGQQNMEQHYANNLSFPVTAFLRFPEETDENKSTLTKLELHDPMEQTQTVVINYAVPLQTDISTPLAYSLNKTNSFVVDTLGFFRPDKAERMRGLYMVRPYEKGKIPVLMVHGLWSSPMTWMEMFNDLQSNPEIRDHYQFWFYLYPTGKQFIETAADLRDDLQEIRREIDPQGNDIALDQMVLVGHSMGGLVAKTITSNSGDAYWNSVSKKPFQQLRASDEAKSNLQRVFFFKPDAHVQRVITIASPHKGSKYASGFVRWLGEKLISLPGRTLDATRQLATLNPNVFRKDENPLDRTSLDSLSPKSPILQVLYSAPKSESARYHNIVGVTKDLPWNKNGDTVVKFNSAHLDDVDSEVVVRADHVTVHQHPRAINEVSRILLLHLQELRRKNGSGVITVEHEKQNDPVQK